MPIEIGSGNDDVISSKLLLVCTECRPMCQKKLLKNCLASEMSVEHELEPSTAPGRTMPGGAVAASPTPLGMQKATSGLYLCIHACQNIHFVNL